jgi:hypothetical protein
MSSILGAGRLSEVTQPSIFSRGSTAMLHITSNSPPNPPRKVPALRFSEGEGPEGGT